MQPGKISAPVWWPCPRLGCSQFLAALKTFWHSGTEGRLYTDDVEWLDKDNKYLHMLKSATGLTTKHIIRLLDHISSCHSVAASAQFTNPTVGGGIRWGGSLDRSAPWSWLASGACFDVWRLLGNKLKIIWIICLNFELSHNFTICFCNFLLILVLKLCD